ncbi:TPA: hypothetical protein ACWZO8_000826 [Streptococcus agalactiae]
MIDNVEVDREYLTTSIVILEIIKIEKGGKIVNLWTLSLAYLKRQKMKNSNLVLSFSNYRHMFNQSDEYSAFFGKKYPNKTREKHLFNLQRKGLLA